MPDAPNFYDPTMPAEAYIDSDRKVHIIVPSDIWVTGEQAKHFGEALIEIAKWIRENYESDFTAGI